MNKFSYRLGSFPNLEPSELESSPTPTHKRPLHLYFILSHPCTCTGRYTQHTTNCDSKKSIARSPHPTPLNQEKKKTIDWPFRNMLGIKETRVVCVHETL